MSQVNPQNYFGFAVSIVLIFLGTRIGKKGISEKSMLRTERVPKKVINKNQARQLQEVHEKEQVKSNTQIQRILPVKEEKMQIPPDSSIPPSCRFYLGYLHERPKKTSGIPKECLECGHVVGCISPTARIIEECSVNH